MAICLIPVVGRLGRLGLNRLGAALVIIVGFVLVLVAVLALAAPILLHQLAAFIDGLPALVTRLQKLIADEGGALSEKLSSGILGDLGLADKLSSVDIQSSVRDLVKQGVAMDADLPAIPVVGWSRRWSVPVRAAGRDPRCRFLHPARLGQDDRRDRQIDPGAQPRHRPWASARLDRAIAGFLRGQSLVCLFLGLWYGVGLSLIGLNFGFLIGVSAGVLSFIPYVGSLTALVISAIVAIVQGWPNWSLFLESMLVVGTGQFLEGNVLTPRLVGDAVGLHPVWLMFALFAFGKLFGFTGLILAVPIAAAIGVLVRFVTRQYLASPLHEASAANPSRRFA